MSYFTRLTFFLVFFVLFVVQTSVCNVDNPIGRASIIPSIIKLEPNTKTTFKVINNPTYLIPAKLSESVIWSVNGVVGGSEEFGRIDKDGNYTSPSKPPVPLQIQIMGETKGVRNTKLMATVVMNTPKSCYQSVYQYHVSLDETEFFSNPHGITLDKDGNIIVVDEFLHHVMRFSPKGEFMGYIGGGPGQNDGQFYKPRVPIIGPDGNLYISDQKLFGRRIQVFSQEGEFIRSFGERGHEPGRILRAHGMDFDSNGNLLIVDIDNFRVTKLSSTGEFITSWGRDGFNRYDLNAPHGLVIDNNDEVFIASYYGTIQKFDSDGNYLFSFAQANPPNSSVFIHAISKDKWGNIYAMVRGLRGAGGVIEKSDIYGIEKFNNNGDFVCGVNLSVSAHSENWAIIDERGYIYALYRSQESAGFEIFSPN